MDASRERTHTQGGAGGGGGRASEGIADRASEGCEAWKEMEGEMDLKREGRHEEEPRLIRCHISFLNNR